MRIQKPNVSVIIPVYNNELYLYETLRSLERQKLKNFEVIVVNDGSTDGSEKIIDVFTKRDRRFKKINQINQGVSAARNTALDIAEGKYVTFVDGDDTLPGNSLQEMYKTAEKYKSHLVIGGIQRIDGFTKKVNQRTQKLKNKEKIMRDDLDLVHGLSLCNKWFLKEIIDENQLRLEKFRHLEDGVFLYHFLQYATKIHFCDVIVYNYLKRIPTDGGSVTQKLEKGLLESAIGAYERLKELTADYPEDFKAELAYRINSTTFIGDYYKKIWRLDETTEQMLLCYVKQIWEKQSEDHKRRTISSHPGLELEKGLRTKEELLKDTIFTIVLLPELLQEDINVILRSIYGQAVPAFHVIADKKFQTCVEDSFLYMKNLQFESLGDTEQDWITSVQKFRTGKYVMLLDQGVVFDYDTLAKAYRIFQEKPCDAIKVHIIQNKESCRLTGLIFKGENMDAKSGFVLQKEAPFILINDIDKVKELTKPTIMTQIKQIMKRIYRKLKNLLR